MTMTMVWTLAPVQASTISGTLSNFDTFNDTPEDSYGAELELEGTHSSDISRIFPSHYDTKTITEYNDGVTFGTRIQFEGYNFGGSSFLPANTVGQNTNGHTCVNTAGCEHFGFSVTTQPTATRFYWLDQNSQRIGAMPQTIPNATWAFVPGGGGGGGGGGGAPMLQAEVQVPEPAEVIAQRPDSIWMKVFKTELDREVNLDELMSAGGVVPEDAAEVETEWELLEGGKMKAAQAALGDGKRAVIRRYEFFEYTGPYDVEHQPTSIFLDQDLPAPPAGELGPFIAANMVAVNLAVPEPATIGLALSSLALLGLARLRTLAGKR